MNTTRIRTNTFFNLGTQRALYDKVRGYVNKEFHTREHIQELKEKYNLAKIYRFDLGQNNDGCAGEVEERFKELSKSTDIRNYLKKYPEFMCSELRKKIAKLHHIENNEWILFSAGLDQMISIIASTFLELNDRIMVNTPSFYLFEEYSKRMGAITIYLQLREEDGFRWTTDTFDEYRGILKKLNPKLIWIANPNNPTGVPCQRDLIEYIVDEAANYFAFIVVDEAYGEYIDPDGEVNSASQLLEKYNNLIVLRTFSKAFGLASLRIAYAMSANDTILDALRIHSNYFPITQFSFDLAGAAVENVEYLEKVRALTKERRERFIKKIEKIPGISYVDSRSNIMMVKHGKLSGEKLIRHLEKDGIVVALVSSEDESVGKYIRLTLGNDEENSYFAASLKKI
ncbi:MAG: histidinol-phosphate aminotransferase family protein [Candidatus Aminicenantes bacterium]|nr:histidinol-phosphate aminotransferase family protein [Candidatus Aminicenantes bacterium]